MLKKLYISNFALINEMDVEFPGELTVITGETGAGKSIFLEALGLALGKRADMTALRNKTRKCIIEATFDIAQLDLGSFFAENDLDPEQEIVLRREISPEGKSRSFLNDSVVGLAALKNLSEKLIDIHSQHQTLLLNQSDFQLELVDAFANSLLAAKNFRADYKELSTMRSKLNQLVEQEVSSRKELDYLQFLFDELSEAGLKTGTLKSLEEQSAALENAESIKGNLFAAGNAISGDHQILSMLAAVKQSLQGLSKFGNDYKELSDRINSVYVEIKELGSDIEDAESRITVDNAALEEVNARIDKISRLLKKHNVKTEDELVEITKSISEKLDLFSSLETGIEKLKKQIAESEKACNLKAAELTALRKSAAPAIEKEIRKMLGELSMENAVFRIEITPLPQLSLSGADQVRFLFTANRGAVPEELSKVASGGELSRLMLTLKAMLASKKELPTIIFDEIDTGVSGDVADRIGNILARMGKSLQVVAITHLPQMASKGKHHLFVYKMENEDKTVSYIRELSKEERVVEIAKMLSTSNPTQSALKNAKELLNA